MNSTVAIWNLALVEIGRPALLATTDDRDEARACEAAWPNTRATVLNAHHWNCATARAQLGSLAQPPDFGYAHQYQLPADFIRFKNSDRPWMRWTIEGRRLLTDDGPTVDIVYIRDITDPAQMAPLLKQTLGLHLAASIAMRVTGDRQLGEILFGKYERSLAEARYADSLQSQDRMVAPTLQNARFGATPRLLDQW